MVTPKDVKALRARKDWSTYDLANEVGCNQSTISRIEAGGKFGGVIEKSLVRLIAAHPEKERA
ncbi:helix-turn-helix transcriptional regulator [Devosia sp.]|uniref:helix-turn-helix transcriptional regulator n=1 Tax=Devosia sp. TaxID=1871048 RepID=UPI001AC596A3|nr:helix-turn-helix transcriptional regulator [Devosia sp.]